MNFITTEMFRSLHNKEFIYSSFLKLYLQHLVYLEKEKQALVRTHFEDTLDHDAVTEVKL